MSQPLIFAYATDDAGAVARLLEESRPAVGRACEGALASVRQAMPWIVARPSRWAMFDGRLRGGSIGGPRVPGSGDRLFDSYWRWLGERDPSLAEALEPMVRGASGESQACRDLASIALGAIDPARSARVTAQLLDELVLAGDVKAISRLALGFPQSGDNGDGLDPIEILSREDPTRILALLESDRPEVVIEAVRMIERTRPVGGVEGLLARLDPKESPPFLVRTLLLMGSRADVVEALDRRLRPLQTAESLQESLAVLESIADDNEFDDPEASAALAVLTDLRERSESGSVRAQVLDRILAGLTERDEDDKGEDDDEADQDESLDEEEGATEPCGHDEALAILETLRSTGLIGEEVAEGQRRLISASVPKRSALSIVLSALLAEGALTGLSFLMKGLDRVFLSLCVQTRGLIQTEAIACPAHRGHYRDDILQFVAGGRLYRLNLIVDHIDHEDKSRRSVDADTDAQEKAIASLVNRLLEDLGASHRFLRMTLGKFFAFGDPATYAEAERRLGFPLLEPLPDCRLELRENLEEYERAADRDFAIRYFRRLVEQPADGLEVLLASARRGGTALHHAATSNLAILIGPTIEAGLPVDIRDRDGLTPLYHAAFYDHAEVVLALLDRGADAYSCDGAGLTVLHAAAMKGSLKVARALLDRGFEVDLPLQFAERSPDEELSMAAELVNAIGLNPFGEYRTGQTPLHLAAMNGQVEAMTLFLDAGAVIDAQDDDGRTPLHLAVSYEEEDAVDFLRERGASTSILDNEGQTPDGRAADAESRRLEMQQRTEELVRELKEHLESHRSTSETGDD